MSELKAKHVVDVYEEYSSNPYNEAQVYLKSEADKVIAEKDKEIAELKEQVSEERAAKVDYKISANDLSDGLKKAYEEIVHHKIKRCLDMAKWCDAEADVADADGDYEDMRWYQKWHDRWLSIADKFKEAK